MESFLSSKLRVGVTIEVRFAVSKPGNSEKVVWWPAHVSRLVASHDLAKATLKGTLQYEAMHGFPITNETVVFNGLDTVQDNSGVEYKWRFQYDNTNLQEILHSDPNGKSTESRDWDYLPHPEGGRGTKRSLDDSQSNHPSQLPQHDMGLLMRKVNILQTQMDSVREEVRGEAALLRTLRSDIHSNASSFTTYAVLPLEYLRHRMEDMLQKGLPLPSRLTAGDFKDGYSMFSQEVGRRVVDCTLSQFDAIASFVNSKMGEVVSMQPSVVDVKTSDVETVSLTFPSLMDLVDVFEPITKRLVTKALVRNRIERSSGRLSALRIIGTVYMCGNNDHLPMVLKPGQGSMTPDVVTSVLYRENTVWNVINDSYEKRLVVMTAPGAAILEQMTRAEGCEHISRKGNNREFTITWKRESNIEDVGILQKRPNPLQVLGTLEVSIPFVIVRGPVVCEEVAELLKVMNLDL